MFNPYNPNGVQFVNGPESVHQIPMMPNSQAIYMDKTQQRFYWAETDAAGQKRVSAYDFKEVTQTASGTVSREEFEELRQSYESIVQRLEAELCRVPAIAEEQKPSRSGGKAKEDGK